MNPSRNASGVQVTDFSENVGQKNSVMRTRNGDFSGQNTTNNQAAQES